LKSTYLKVQKILKILNFINSSEVIFVNNNSKDLTKKVIKDTISLKDGIKKKYVFEKDFGLSSATLAGLKHAKGTSVLPIPGHDLWTYKTIHSLIKIAKLDEVRLVLAYRKNKKRNRPFIKYLSSQILVKAVNTLFKLNLMDINGLLLWPTSLLKKYTLKNAGHAHVLYPLVMILSGGVKIDQIPGFISLNHHKRSSRDFSDNFPKVTHIYTTLKYLVILKYRAKQIEHINKFNLPVPQKASFPK